MQQLIKMRAFVILLGIAFVILDQWVKVEAVTSLQLNSSRLGGSFAWLDIALSLNPGAFLSLGAELAPAIKQVIFITGVGVVVCWAIGWSLFNWTAARVKAMGVYCIALGGLSNLIDRLARDEHVVDYLVLNFGRLHSGVFNIAYMAIMVGAVVLALNVTKSSSRTQK